MIDPAVRDVQTCEHEGKGKEDLLFISAKLREAGGEMIRICLTVCPTLEPKHEAGLLFVAVLK